MLKRAFLPILAVLAVSSANALSLGDSHESVERELGQPTATFSKDEIRVDVFAGVAKVTFEDNHVIAVKLLLRRENPPPTPDPSMLRDAPIRQRATPRTQQPQTIPDPSPNAPAQTSARPSENAAAPQNQTATVSAKATAPAPEENANTNPPAAWKVLAVFYAIQAAIIFIATLGTVFLCCRYWEVDMFASGFLLTAAINVIPLLAISLAVNHFMSDNVPQQAQSKIAAILVTLFWVPTLTMTVKKFSFNQDIGASLRVALFADLCLGPMLLLTRVVLFGLALDLTGA